MANGRPDDTLIGYLDGIARQQKGEACYRENLILYAPTCRGKCEGLAVELAHEVAKVFGGATVYGRPDGVEGCWDGGKGLECEPVLAITVARPCIGPGKAVALLHAISRYGQKAKQQQLGLESGGKFYLSDTARFGRSDKIIKKRVTRLFR